MVTPSRKLLKTFFFFYQSNVIRNRHLWGGLTFEGNTTKKSREINSYLPSGLFHPQQLGESIFTFRSVFLAHMSRRHIWWAYRIDRPPSVSVGVRRTSSSTLFKHLLLRNQWANQSQISYGASMGWGNESLLKWSWSLDQDGRHAHICWKQKKIFFSRTKRPTTLNLGMHHRVLEFYQGCSNDDPGLTLTNCTARSNLVPYAFVWEKGKTMDFSEIIVVYDLKLATYDRSDKKFLWHQNFVHWGPYVPCPVATYMY